MLSNSFVKFCLVGLAVGFVLWCGITFGPAVGVLVALALLLIVAIATYYEHSYISLNEMEVGVVFNRKGNFVCFLDNDYGRIEPGKPRPRKRAKPLSRHSINPYEERLTNIMTKSSQKGEGTLDKVRTIEGIPIKIKYAVSFKIIAMNIPAGMEFKMARGLPTKAPGMVSGKASKALAHLIETKSIHDLYRVPGATEGAGSLQKLENELREIMIEKTKVYGADIGKNDVKLGPVELPDGFETALQSKFQKELQTETLVDGLTQLRKAISEYEEDDIKRLSDLVRLRILDEQNEPLMVTESIIDWNETKDVVKYKNGRTKKAKNGREMDN